MDRQPTPDSFTVESTGDATSVILLDGEITPAAEQPLMAAYGRATQSGATALVLDFTGLDYMNSGGIGLLVTLLVRAQRSRQRLLACGLSEHYRQILELTRLDEAIEIHADRADAVAAADATERR